MLSTMRSNTRITQSLRRFFSATPRQVVQGPQHVERSAAPSYTPSLAEKFFSASKYPRVPLNEAFPGVQPATTTEPVPISTEATVSTLPNGLRVVTLPSNYPVTSVGVFIDCGSRYENEQTNGITHFLEAMSLKSTSNRSDFRLVRDMSKLGVNLLVAAAREYMMYGAEVLHKEHLPHMVGTLADIIQNNIYHPQEIIEEREAYLKSMTERGVDVKIMEAIHEAAYGNQTLGLSLYPPQQNVEQFTPESFYSYVDTFFTPKRMVVCAIGVDHAQFSQLVAENFNNLSEDVSELTKQPATYTGGEIRVHDKSQHLAHVALAFETASWHSADLVPMCVLQQLLGGGGSFSAGGPGKGMYSRIYSNMLNKYEWIDSCQSFNSIFTDSSLFGIYGTSVPEKSKNLVEAMTKELIKCTGPVAAVELSRAKQQLKSAVYMQLESRSLRLEDVGRQVMTYGKVQTPQQIAALIDNVTEADIQRVAKTMLATPPSVAAIGDLSYLPRYDVIQRAFK